jgi:prepilin-type N-terminal cleavage/methylation domain-containing protein
VKNKRGFALIELLFVITLVATIGITFFVLKNKSLSKNQLNTTNVYPTATKKSGTNLIVIKFDKGLDVDLQNGTFTSADNIDLDSLNALVSNYSATAGRVFSRDPKIIEQERIELEKKTGEDVPNLNLYFKIQLIENISPEEKASFIEQLQKMNFLETSYEEPVMGLP